MSYSINENRLGQTLIGAVDTAAAVPVGTIVRASDPTYGAGEFIYLKGVASTATGSFVTYNADDGSTALLAADAIGPVAVAMGATVASTWGWYQISGKAVGKALVDDAVVAGDRVKRAKGASAVGTPSAGLAEFEIDRPFADDASAA
jgi:hypothetical protein